MSKIDGGYILLARKILDSDIMDKPPLWLKLWVWMLEKANHKNDYKGLKRGQFFTTMKELQKEMSWYVGGRHHIPSYDKIRAPLRYWSSRRPPENRPVTISKTTRGMVITIHNYNRYQDPKNYENHAEDRPKTARRPATPCKAKDDAGSTPPQQELTRINNKRIKELSNEIYDIYKSEIQPLRKSSTRAKENIAHYLKHHSSENLKQAILNYKMTIYDRVDGTWLYDSKHRKDPANFFGKNDRYFIDYLPDNFEPPEKDDPLARLREKYSK
jgi:hypothetical protein